MTFQNKKDELQNNHNVKMSLKYSQACFKHHTHLLINNLTQWFSKFDIIHLHGRMKQVQKPPRKFLTTFFFFFNSLQVLLFVIECPV